MSTPLPFKRQSPYTNCAAASPLSANSFAAAARAAGVAIETSERAPLKKLHGQSFRWDRLRFQCQPPHSQLPNQTGNLFHSLLQTAQHCTKHKTITGFLNVMAEAGARVQNFLHVVQFMFTFSDCHFSIEAMMIENCVRDED
jgi:hypothetical protein